MNRLKRTEGQIRGVQKMIDEEQECMDIMTQLNAIRSGIDRVMGLVVVHNLQECFEHPEKDPKEQDKKLEKAINMIIKK
ncbi:MAG TPA: metal-sensitive transcriptional regulator [Candidatus Dorea intestinavium]|nr:metal-sensitive transcriptional regulator [Candidatus Dorea intestinavium]